MRPLQGDWHQERARGDGQVEAGCDHPDQVDGRDHVGEQPGPEISGDEGDGAPHPHLAVEAAAHAQTLQRVGVGQRHHRGHRDGGEAIGDEHQRDAGGVAEQGHARGGRQRGKDQRALERPEKVGGPRRQRNRNHAQDRRGAKQQADGLLVEPLRHQPKRQERHLNADAGEQGRVEQRHPGTKPMRGSSPSSGLLSGL